MDTGDVMFITAYAGILCFTVMSFINFTIQAIPVMAVFVIYSAALCSKYSAINQINFPVQLNFAVPNKVAGISLCCFAIAVLSLTLPEFSAQLNSKKAQALFKAGRFSDSEKVLSQLKSELKESESYWQLYGNVLYKRKNYSEALQMYLRAISLSSNPEIYKQAASCYQHLRQPDKTEQFLLKALYLEPNSFSSRYALAKLYFKSNSIDKAELMAKDIISLVPKIPSVKVESYKAKARKMLVQLKPHSL